MSRHHHERRGYVLKCKKIGYECINCNRNGKHCHGYCKKVCGCYAIKKCRWVRKH